MCWKVQADLECSTPGCKTIIAWMAHYGEIRCPVAENGGLELGGCGQVGARKLKEPQKADQPSVCGDCQAKRKQNQRERYANAAKYVADLRDAEQTRDDQRRRRLESRSATPRPAEQAALVYGAGTGWSAGQGGGAHEAYGMYSDAEMFISGMPQELDWGPEDDTMQQGWDDPGEGPSQVHDEQYTHRYG